MNIEYPKIPIGRAKDLTAQKFGKLTALYRTENVGKRTHWVCQCECGKIVKVSAGHLERGHTTSCGCYKKTASLKDISGQKFGKLTVLEYDYSDKKGHTYWKCQCECGVIKSIRKDGLTSGNVVSCGCHKTQITKEINTNNLLGKRFGKLTVIERVGSNQHNQALWKCKCDCGTEKIIVGTNLSKGETNSCGCLKSKGEQKIADLLQKNNIKFQKEKTFTTCILPSGHKAKFDFYIKEQYLIEFDGIQHFKSGSGWNTIDKLQQTQQSDKIKNEWCKENNIPLIRIPYSAEAELTIKDLMLETSNYVYYKGD